MNATRSTRFAFVTLAGIAVASTAVAGTPPALQFDPFREPPKVVVGKDRPQAVDDADVFVPVLRSTVVGGERSLANLGGQILAIGEEANGYRLISVDVFEAEFSKDGRIVKLEVEAARGGER